MGYRHLLAYSAELLLEFAQGTAESIVITEHTELLKVLDAENEIPLRDGWKTIGECAGDLSPVLGVFRTELRGWLRRTDEVLTQFEYDNFDNEPSRDIVHRAFGLCSEHIFELGELQEKAKTIAKALLVPEVETARKRLVSKQVYAKLLNVSIKTINRRIEAGKLPFVKIDDDKNYSVELDKDGQIRTA